MSPNSGGSPYWKETHQPIRCSKSPFQNESRRTFACSVMSYLYGHPVTGSHPQTAQLGLARPSSLQRGPQIAEVV